MPSAPQGLRARPTGKASREEGEATRKINLVKQVLSILLGGVAILGALAACGGTSGGTTPTTATTKATATSQPTPASVPSATTTPVPAPSRSGAVPPTPAASEGGDLIADGKLIFEKTFGGVGCSLCHGLDGKGGLQGATPNIRGATEARVRAALGGGVPQMTFAKLSEKELMAVLAYLKYLTEQP